MDPYLIIHSKSTFTDHQSLKLQEAPDMVPVGELPRHMLLSADRYLTGRVVPGSRVIATGIFSTFQGQKSVRALFVSTFTRYLHMAEINSCTSHTVPQSGSPRDLDAFIWCYWWYEPIWSTILTRRRGGIRGNGAKRKLLRKVCAKCSSEYLWQFGCGWSGSYYLALLKYLQTSKRLSPVCCSAVPRSSCLMGCACEGISTFCF